MHPGAEVRARARGPTRLDGRHAAPRAAPAWLKADSFAGARARGRRRTLLRGLWTDGGCPAHAGRAPGRAPLRRTSSSGTGHPAPAGGRDGAPARRREACRSTWATRTRRAPGGDDDSPGCNGWPSCRARSAPLETARRTSSPWRFRFQPRELVARLSPGPRPTGRDVLHGCWPWWAACSWCLRRGARPGPDAGPLDHAQRARALAGHRAAAPGRLRAAASACRAATSSASWPTPST